MRRLSVLLALAGALCLCAAAPAWSALDFARCGSSTGAECATLTVPLDRTGAEAGQVTLHVERLLAKGTERGVMLLVAGGPGQASTESFGLTTANGAAFAQALFPGY